MFSRVLVTEQGDSSLLSGQRIELDELKYANDKVKKGDSLAKAEELLLGISKVSLSTSSFLSAASFQETSRVLINAAVEGKVDYLRGLKENVIIGRLIPAGTGFKTTENTRFKTDVKPHIVEKKLEEKQAEEVK